MKNLYLLLILAITLGCTQSNEEKLSHISGYWEIASIENPAGQVKEFSMSQNIDFFEVNADGKGVRKKVQPNVVGEFTTSQSSENINVVYKDDLLLLEYATAMDTWQETVKKATTDELVLINEDGLIYTYRKYTPLALD
ncbi:hypothetical protein [Dokdonia sp. Dokd-P16]|uniref:hypothetical protein n=1 Tax=Dokdonia sp. Dokd-P16 TaxID=2173169 RepID=UPI0013A59792|nr:hypothetical protein [Dokdonia sp. Dokd-P16]